MLFSHTLLAALSFTAAPCALAQGPGEEGQVGLGIDFEEADTNNDGQLSNEEVSAVIVATLTEQFKEQLGDQAEEFAEQVAPQIVESLFEAADTNSDGFLTEQELEGLGQ